MNTTLQSSVNSVNQFFCNSVEKFIESWQTFFFQQI